MSEYTPEQLEAVKLCSGCKIAFYDETMLQCGDCHERGAANREAARVASAAVPPEHICAIAKCPAKGLLDDAGVRDKYCAKHQHQNFLDDLAARKLRPCKNHIRGCLAELAADYAHKTCEACLKLYREQDHARRHAVPTEAAAAPTEAAAAPTEAAPAPLLVKTCTICVKEQPADQFAGKRNPNAFTKTCLTCRTANALQDTRRDRAHRNELERARFRANPALTEVKNRWREHNHDKIVETWRASRIRRREAMGDEAFLRHNADTAKEWRDANPEKVAAQLERNKENPAFQFLIYFRKARDAGVAFEIDYDYYLELVNSPCAYCACVAPRGFHGVDRKDNALGYVPGNCASACTMCNFMKGSESAETLARRAEHILTHHDAIVDGRAFPDEFPNATSVSFGSLTTSANTRSYDVEITEQDFYVLTDNACYVCGKESVYDQENLATYHRNGVDRYDNAIGYTLENCVSCCKTCNYLKRDHSYDNLMQKLAQIYRTAGGAGLRKDAGTEFIAFPACARANRRALKAAAAPVVETEEQATARRAEQARNTAMSRARKIEKLGVDEVRRQKAETRAANREREAAEVGAEEFRRRQAEAQAAYRERTRTEPRIVAKTVAERSREYRQRKKDALANEQG